MQVQGWNPTDQSLFVGTSPQKLQRAGQIFEGMLLADTFSKLQETMSGDAEDDSDPGHDTLNGLACEALGNALAARGGLGLGKMMTDAINRSSSGRELPMDQVDARSGIIRKR